MLQDTRFFSRFLEFTVLMFLEDDQHLHLRCRNYVNNVNLVFIRFAELEGLFSGIKDT